MGRLDNTGKIALHGVVQNPIFVLVLGMCPTIKKTTNVTDAFYLGLATLCVLLLGNIIISLMRKIIPDKVRLPVYIIIIATLVTLVEIVLKSELADKYLPGIYDNLGEMISLIAVNCLILSRVESFASKNNVLVSAIDGLSMGIGFTLSLCLMGALRQMLASLGFAFFVTTSGGFLLLGLLMALFNAVYEQANRMAAKKKKSMLVGG